MKEITRIRKTSIAIFLLPLLAINLGLLFNNYISLYIIDNYKFIISFYDKFPILEQIHLDALEKHYLLTKPTFPYIRRSWGPENTTALNIPPLGYGILLPDHIRKVSAYL